MSIKFVSNSEILFPGFENFQIDEEKELNLQADDIDTSGNCVFIIDVHLNFKNDAQYMLDFGGFTLYNKLYHLYGKKVCNLKVIFYTPLRWRLLEKFYQPNLHWQNIPHFQTFNFEKNFEYFIDFEIWMQINHREKNNSWCNSIIFNKKIKFFDDKLEQLLIPFKQLSPFNIGVKIYNYKSELLNYFGENNLRNFDEEEEDDE